MARRRKTSPFEDLISIASKLPWWLSLVLAFVAWLLLHSFATSPAPTLTDPKQMGDMLVGQVLRTFALFGQYLIPAAFVFGAIGSVFARVHRRKLLNDVATATQPGKTVDGLNWREFEMIVGEAMRHQGFTVTERGGDGPDGGVDLDLRKDGEKYLVQCKHWRTMKVGLAVVREFFGAMAAEGAVGGFVVTSGSFTEEAKAFAEGRNIRLVAAAELSNWISLYRKASVRPTSIVGSIASPICPKCRAPMIIRTAKRGANAGVKFWGCTEYPKCKGIVGV